MSDIRYWLWLSSAPGVSARSKASAIAHFGDAEAVFNAPAGAIGRTEGISSKDAEILERRDMQNVDNIYERCRQDGIGILCFNDAAYPARLRNIYAPPVVLYIRGNLPPVDRRPVIAVVGTRKASEYGLKMGRRIGFELCMCGGTVVSGLTSGIDSTALIAALDAGGECIAILGLPHELEHSPLAERIAEKGALISEYPPGTTPYRSFFRERNRITSGLSLGVVAVEAPEKSGTALFIAEAAEQGREIFAVPGNADSEKSVGTNGFIKDGAKPVTCGWDILCEFENRWDVKNVFCEVPESTAPATAQTGARPGKRKSRPKKENAPQQKVVDKKKDTIYSETIEIVSGLPEDQRSIVNAISCGCELIDDIIDRTGLVPARVLSQLTVLEIKGLVKRLPGRRVTVNFAKK